MQGVDRARDGTRNDVRFCAACEQQVHDLSSLTEREVRSLVARHSGRLCVRFAARDDGTVVTRLWLSRLPLVGRWVQLVALGVGLWSAIMLLRPRLQSRSRPAPPTVSPRRAILGEPRWQVHLEQPTAPPVLGGAIMGLLNPSDLDVLGASWTPRRRGRGDGRPDDRNHSARVTR